MTVNASEEIKQTESSLTSTDGSRPEPLKRRRASRRGPKWLRRLGRQVNARTLIPRLLLFVVVALTVIGVGGLVLATDATARVEASFASLNRVLDTTFNRPGTELTLDDFTKLRSGLDDVTSTLAGVQRQARLVRPFLELNDDLAATLVFLDAANDLARAGDAMLEGLEPTLFFLVGGDDTSAVTTQISSGERIVELLALGRPSFVNAGDILNQAAQHIQTIENARLSADTLLQLEQLRGFHEQLVEIQALLMTAPDLLRVALGLNEEQSYLVLSQNSDELRPSGGYLSTYGWFVIRNGRVVDYSYSEVTSSNPNPPDESFADEIQPPEWWLPLQQPIYGAWDSGWSPDFPSTAQRAMWFYNNGNNPQSPVGGVIAIDIVAFEYILEALEQVEVPDFNRVVTPQNFRAVVYDIRATNEGDRPHKQFLAALYGQIFDDWQNSATDPAQSETILGVLLRGLQEKHIMIYSADPTLNQALDLLGWSGRQQPGVGQDYLMVVDANLGNKSNSSIRRQTTLDVDISGEGSVSNRVTINYDYSDSVASLDPAVNPQFHGSLTYNNLLQVYVPAEAQLIEEVGQFIDFEAHGADAHGLFTSIVSIPYNTSERFQIAYTAPDIVETVGEYQRYTLLIQKQPGMRAENVNLQISLPPGATLVSSTPVATATYTINRPILEYRLEVRGDVEIEIVYTLDA